MDESMPTLENGLAILVGFGRVSKQAVAIANKFAVPLGGLPVAV